METLFDSPIYSVINFLLYIILAASAFGTIVIPTFFNDKMMKPHRNYVSGLSLRNRWDSLDRYGKLFVWCVIFSGFSGFVLSKLDSWESEYQAKKHFSEILDIKLDAQNKLNKKDLEYNDSLRKRDESIKNLNQERQVKGVQDTLNNTNNLIRQGELQNEILRLQLSAAHKENMQLQNEVNSPILSFDYSSENPKLYYDTLKKSFAFDITIGNVGKGHADSFRKQYTYIGLIRGRLHVISNFTGRFQNTFSQLQQGRGETTTIWLGDTSAIESNGIMYVAFKFSYRNRFKQARPPLIVICRIDLKYINKPIPLLSDSDYTILTNLLTEKKVWEK